MLDFDGDGNPLDNIIGVAGKLTPWQYAIKAKTGIREALFLQSVPQDRVFVLFITFSQSTRKSKIFAVV